MMSDLRELYQEMILDHGRSPRHHHAMPLANRLANGFNQLCGDRLTVYLKTDQDKITAISFQGSGCAISMASASLMSELLSGKTLNEAESLFEIFHQLLTSESTTSEQLLRLKKLAVFSGVKAYPARVKCATLAWHTLLAALNQNTELVSTEH
ncbi:iron-sulfur cluster assembly scaffold protein [Candidatus Rickettsiella isopodorum]|jgi:nitrogen fixation NifU-like protein|uniref:Iron-sulfur cluster assembly scaffold protein n=1 Tax=Candidatus Rickettsiella isopodorum TaxID=1225476 RepID=A0A1J8NJN8_9COXI|nr:SUF system NifU family Fe-S cluster assembly protein [Candidatus Rickettsiella isopodorum]OIZ95122.1 iron-sulfur cluster assembly scaffold protein [Candidatus Rickettsiella isopodorum]